MPPISKTAKNIKNLILQYISGKRYSPLGKKALCAKLGIAKHHYPICEEIFEELLSEGLITLVRNQVCIKQALTNTMRGILRLHPRGFGFVVPDDVVKYPEDIFIPKHAVSSAVDSDYVEVKLLTPTEKGPEGEIVSIIKRGRKALAGVVHYHDHRGEFYAYAPLLGPQRPIKIQSDQPLSRGERYLFKILSWGNEKEPIVAEPDHYIGSIEDPSCDIDAAILEFGFSSEFPKAVLKEAKKWGDTVKKKDLTGRVDLTGMETFTIDPVTAKDFDDALSVEKKEDGYFLAVHIADVAHYVKSGSALDEEAYARANSTYFPGMCLPMLPHELSSSLCSLMPKVIRLTASVLMEFDKEGNLLNHAILRSFIKSAKRFSYEEAKLVLDKKKKSAHRQSLEHMVELCLLLKKKRAERGSVDFSLPEVIIKLDKKGQSTGLEHVEYDITHQMVEEFMLKANELVATHLSDKGLNILYRIHEKPAEDNLKEFIGLARGFGFNLPLEATIFDFQKFFYNVKDTPFGQFLAVSYIRNMKQASYSPENIGHFGLSLEYYTHFTSPIRRYSDLIIQRILFKEEGADIDLKTSSQRCSEQERLSMRAEMYVKQLKKIRLLEYNQKELDKDQYKAIITKIKPFGIYFEIENLMLEGFIRISELSDDYYIFDEKRHLLTGRHLGKTFRLAQEIAVKLITCDLILQEAKWALHGMEQKIHHSKKKYKS